MQLARMTTRDVRNRSKPANGIPLLIPGHALPDSHGLLVSLAHWALWASEMAKWARWFLEWSDDPIANAHAPFALNGYSQRRTRAL